MLKGISPLLSPELLHALSSMGHGDEIVLADANFPAASYAKQLTVVRCDGHSIPSMLKAILPLFPLDDYVEKPVALMAVVPGDDFIPVVWERYSAILAEHGCPTSRVEEVERFAFYERTKKAFAVVATGETSKYGNIILKKGVITPD